MGAEFFDNVLIKLKRKYSKDDLVRALISENDKLKKEIDKLDEYRYNTKRKAKIIAQQQVDKLTGENKRLKDKNICLLLRIKELEKLQTDETNK